MTTKLLRTQFDKIVDAPNASVNLRKFILDLAVRGRLVKQNLKDEPASKLLQKIQSAKRKVDVKPQILLPSVAESKIPFGIPVNWEWVYLNEVAKIIMGQSPPSSDYLKKPLGLPFFQGKAEFGEKNPTPKVWCSKPKKIAEKDDILISVRAPIGPTNIAITKCGIGRGLAAVRSEGGFYDRGLILIILKSYKPYLVSKGSGSVFGAIKKEQLYQLLIPLPPLPEQKRIVAKVNELMAVCDALEKAQIDRETARQKLVEAVAHDLSHPPVSFAKSAKFMRQNFSHITARSDYINTLKRTILDLAVRGRLVKQNPQDEPASKLLQKIQLAKRKVSTKPQKPLPPIAKSEIPFETPANWEWVRLGNICELIYGKGLPISDRIDYGRIPAYGANGIKAYTNKEALCKKPSIIVGRKGSAGAINMVNEPFWAMDVSYYVMFNDEVATLGYLYYGLLHQNLPSLARGIKPGINRNEVHILLTPLPPLEEQKRIVAKVNELMKICDALQVELTLTQTARARLLESVTQLS